MMQQISVMRNADDNKLVAFQTWIPVDKRIKVGTVLTFKDLEHDWTVTQVYDNQLEMDEVTSNRNWDNNNYDKHTGTPLKDRK